MQTLFYYIVIGFLALIYLRLGRFPVLSRFIALLGSFLIADYMEYWFSL